MTSQETDYERYDHERMLKAEFRMRCWTLLAGNNNRTVRIEVDETTAVLIDERNGYIQAAVIRSGHLLTAYAVDALRSEEYWNTSLVALIALPAIRKYMVLDDLSKI